MFVMKTYRTRISLLLVLFIIIVSIVPVVFIDSPIAPYIVSVAIVDIVVFICFFGIKYVIDGDVLKVYSFWGIHEDIPISSIKKIEKSRNPLSSPAASLDRLAVHYNKYDVVYISPRNQDDFLEEIGGINKDIVMIK